MKKLLHRLFAPIAALLALAPTASAAKAPQVARPALWAVSDADTTIYLFGTFHALDGHVGIDRPIRDREH